MNFGKTFLAALLAVVVGSMLAGIFMMMIFAGIVASFETKTVTAGPNSVLRLDFTDGVTDSPDESPFSSVGFGGVQLNNSMSIMQVLNAIENASYDNNIKGIYINVTGGSVSLANVEEIRAALERFREESGKFVFAYSEVYSQVGYYLASVADKVYVHPEGGIAWQGLASEVLFYKGTLEKLGVEVEIFRHGTFKSAVEPFMLDRMSAENKYQLNTVLGSIWDMMLGDISQSRNIPVESLSHYASSLSLENANDALEYGFVDAVMYEDKVDEMLWVYANSCVMEEIPQEKITLTKDTLTIQTDSTDVEIPLSTAKPMKFAPPSVIELRDYIASSNLHAGSMRGDRIAVVYVDGGIIDGVSHNQNVGGATIARKLEDTRRDDRVKGVVLRVNSPGGSALASDVIWREMELLRREKPVVVSMGGYAASGGYYVSCPADIILSDRSTLTGSIGVFGLLPNAGKALKNILGITSDVAKTNQHADMGSIFRPMDNTEREFIQRSVEAVYQTFIGHVAAGRNLTVERVDEIGGGRVWSGANALEIGLVDGIGGLIDAIEICADRAGIADSYRVKEILDEPDMLSLLVRSLSSSARAEALLKNQLGETFVEYKKLLDMLGQPGVQARMPYEINIR